MADKSFASALSALRKNRSDAPKNMRKAFAEDPTRFASFSLRDGDLLLDFSKCAVTAKTMRLLERLADAAGLADKRKAMLAGKRINITEDRAVLHTALRNLTGKGIKLAGQDIQTDVNSVLGAMEAFANAIRSGAIPKAATLSSAVETAAKWCTTASLPNPSSIQRRAVSALVIVSMVVKVFDATIKSVVSGFSPFSVSWICAPSTLET